MRKQFPDLDPSELTPDREEKRSLRELQGEPRWDIVMPLLAVVGVAAAALLWWCL